MGQKKSSSSWATAERDLQGKNRVQLRPMERTERRFLKQVLSLPRRDDMSAYTTISSRVSISYCRRLLRTMNPLHLRQSTASPSEIHVCPWSMLVLTRTQYTFPPKSAKYSPVGL